MAKDQKYKKYGIDKFIVQLLESKDKTGFSGNDKILFFRELSYMLKGGVGLVKAVSTISSGTSNYAMKTIVNSINKFLLTGKSLSYAMARLPEYFDEGDCSVIQAGEKSGNMVSVLDLLAKEYEYINEIKNKYISALIYPIILIVIAIIAIIALFGFILPSVFDLAVGVSVSELPFSTRILKGFCDFFVNNWKFVLWGILLIVLFLWLYLSTEKGKKSWFDFLLSLPLIGNMTRYYYLVRWCRYMKLMLSSGMNYVETFKTLRDVLGIGAYKNMIERILVGLQKGDSIYNSLKDETDLIPSNVAVLINVGEETANLDGSLGNILAMYQEELNITINSISKVIEPVILIFIGVIVALVASGVFGLIFQIMEGI